MFAARHGAVAALRELIKGGADLDAKTPEGFSSIVIALNNLHFDAAKVLVDAGANPDGGGLFSVVEARNRVNYVGEIQVPTGAEGSLELLKSMLSHGADLMDRLPQPLLDRDSRFGPPPPKITDVALIRAARSADVDAMRVLIEGGADPSMHDEKRGGINTLVAVMMGPELPAFIEADRRPTEDEAIAAIDFLLDQGVKPTIANDLGATALHMAALRNYPGVIKHMAEKGVDLNVADREGYTPLDYALGHLPVEAAGQAADRDHGRGIRAARARRAREGRRKDGRAMRRSFWQRCGRAFDRGSRRRVAHVVHAIEAGNGRRARRHRRPVLRGLPQPGGTRGRARARESEPHRSGRAAREMGKGDSQAQRRAHAAARRAAAERRSRGGARVLSRDESRRDRAEAARRADTPAESRGLRQCRPGLARVSRSTSNRCCLQRSRAMASTTSQIR